MGMTDDELAIIKLKAAAPAAPGAFDPESAVIIPEHPGPRAAEGIGRPTDPGAAHFFQLLSRRTKSAGYVHWSVTELANIRLPPDAREPTLAAVHNQLADMETQRAIQPEDRPPDDNQPSRDVGLNVVSKPST